MKKALALLFVLLVVLSLCLTGCDSKTEPTQGTSPSTESTLDNSQAGDKPEEIKDGVVITLDKDLSSSGLMVGEIWLKNVSGEYTLYFGDEAGQPLDGYTKLGVVSNTQAYKLENCVVPPDGKTVVAVSENERHFTKIPDTCLLSRENAFVFGALSDVHFGKYDKIAEDDAVIAFDTALDYFEKIGVDMVGVAGDITNNGETESLVKYNEAISNRPFPVLTVTGNHDYEAYKNGTWQEYITANIEDCQFAPNGLDFVYASEEMGGDVFVFLNITFYSYSYFDKSMPVIDVFVQYPWLDSILKEHQDDQIYVFFHLFMCGPDGQGHTGVGNLMNPGGYTYPLPFKYGNSDEKRIRALFKKYKNVVYLSGHSHWAFEMEKYNEDTNFSDFDGEYCTMVHIPSVTEPRWIEDEDTDRTGKNGEMSQGWIFYDYGDTTVLVPIDFTSGTIYTEYMEIVKK